MSNPETFVCGHGRTIETGTKEPLAECDADIRALVKDEMTGDERADALHWLMSVPCCTRFGTIHEVAEKLVGRPVWTHEFATAERLVEEARTQQHPVDLEAHVIGSLDQLAGNKPVMVVRPE